MKDNSYLKIPKARIGAVIGKNGETKNLIELKTKAKIDVGPDGSVTIRGGEDQLLAWKAQDVIKAIGRGFSPKNALELIRDDMELSIINLKEATDDKISEMRRIKSRVIGEKGKAKRTIENITGSRISVYGKTIAIIAPEEKIEDLEKAMGMLMDGARHKTVYSFLEAREKERKVDFYTPTP
jgi:ribosomal RNA assembly protein